MKNKLTKLACMGVFMPAIVALHSYAFMLLWNLLITDIFDLRVINFWEALGLVAIVKLLFMVGSHKKGGCKCGHGAGYCNTDSKGDFKQSMRDHFKTKYCGSDKPEEKE